jgi:DNA helicase-2/ATP-dependent DNA helicase PcrA
MSFLNELNPQQKKAATCVDGPLLILAGAGAGKTKTITYRIAHLITEGVDPRNILAVTFTNKAANEMKDRIDSLLSSQGPISIQERPFVKTFHSLGVHILRENFNKLNLPSRFSILDRDDSKKIIRNLLKNKGYDPKQYDTGKILGIISRQKNEMLSPEEYFDNSHNHFSEIITTIWREYEKQLQKEGALDFDDLLLKTTKLLKEDKEVREIYQNQWKWIHIDEYQDTNEVQYTLSKLLGEKHQNICVVGDVDQNIYTWRGATIKNIMNFEKDYPQTQEIILEQNYRSTKNILQAANEVISKNKIRKEKNLFTKNTEGEKISAYRSIDEYGEAEFAVKKAKELINNGTSPNEIAFLYRANFQSRVLEEICLKEKLPHQVIGTRFFDRKEVKDILAYIKTATNPKDFTSLNRIINTPTRGIGKVTILKIHDEKESELTPAVQDKIKSFRNLLKRIEKKAESGNISEMILYTLKESGFEDKFKKDGEDGLERLENVRELAALAKKYSNVEQFLEDVSLTTDQDSLNKNNDGVKLMTVHAAKGLEFDYVFITGLEDGVFPHIQEGGDGKITTEEKEEEERRLFYVAITRAKKKIFLLWASFRTIFGSKEISSPSPFLNEISSDLIEEEVFAEDNGLSGQYNKREDRGDSVVEYLIDF